MLLGVLTDFILSDQLNAFLYLYHQLERNDAYVHYESLPYLKVNGPSSSYHRIVYMCDVVRYLCIYIYMA